MPVSGLLNFVYQQKFFGHRRLCHSLVLSEQLSAMNSHVSGLSKYNLNIYFLS